MLKNRVCNNRAAFFNDVYISVAMLVAFKYRENDTTNVIISIQQGHELSSQKTNMKNVVKAKNCRSKHIIMTYQTVGNCLFIKNIIKNISLFINLTTKIITIYT